MKDEQLYKQAFGEMQQLLTRSETDLALVKAQAEFYLDKYNELKKENQKLIDENNQLKEDLRKLEGEPDPHPNTTEETK